MAVLTGVKPEDVVLAEDGVVVDLEDGHARVVGAVPVSTSTLTVPLSGDLRR